MCLSAAVAQREVRGHPPARLRDGAGDEVRAGELFQLLNARRPAPEPEYRTPDESSWLYRLFLRA